MSDDSGGNTDTSVEVTVGADVNTDTGTGGDGGSDLNDNGGAEVSTAEEGGSITTDEHNRFLSEIAAYHGFNGIVAQVTKDLKAKIGDKGSRP